MKHIVILAAALWATTSFASIVNVDQINDSLAKSKASWKAKDTWLNQLDEKNIHRVLGARGVEENIVDFKSVDSSTKEAVDWRNYNGQDFVGSILNQGNCGSCVAFAAAATLETQVNITSGVAGLNPKFSTEALFACGGGGCDFGWFPSSAAQYMKTTGVPDEACAPYTMGATGVDTECSSICSDASSRAYKITNYNSYNNAQAVKDALKRGPLMTTLLVYADFLVYSSGVYRHTTGSALGGHAVSLIGFDDTKRAWIIRNSWGTNWGMDGFGYVSYDDNSGVGSQGWLLNVPRSEGYVQVDLEDRTFVSGAFAVQAHTTLTAPNVMSLQLTNSNRDVVRSYTCNTEKCTFNVDSTSLPDGRYTLRATAAAGAKVVESAIKYFYVANTVPNLAIQMTPNGFNPARAVSGRIEFDLAVQTNTPNPMQRLALMIKRPDGSVDTPRWTENVLPHTVAGWRTNAWPNGDYEVWFRGVYTVAGHEYSVDGNHLRLKVQN